MTTAQGKLIAGIMASLAELERELIRERVKSGLQAAKVQGKKLGRKHGDTFKQNKHEQQVMKLRSENHSYRAIAEKVGIDKDTGHGNHKTRDSALARGR